MRIRRLAGGVSVITAVDFHDELPSRSDEVNDAGANDHLAAEPHPELAAGKLSPQAQGASVPQSLESPAHRQHGISKDFY